MQCRGAGGLDQKGRSGGGAEWPDLGCPLKVEPAEFADRLDVRHEIE